MGTEVLCGEEASEERETVSPWIGGGKRALFKSQEGFIN